MPGWSANAEQEIEHKLLKKTFIELSHYGLKEAKKMTAGFVSAIKFDVTEPDLNPL